MTFLSTFLLLLAAGNQSSVAPDQPFRLEPGDYRWMTITARKTPLSVDCGFSVVQGKPTVHLELLPLRDFHAFTRGRDYNTLALTGTGRSGEFRRLIDDPGSYALLIVNDRNAPPATVTLHVSTTLNPNPADVAASLSPGKRLAVVALSLGFFLISIAWSGHTLIRAMRRNRPQV